MSKEIKLEIDNLDQVVPVLNEAARLIREAVVVGKVVVTLGREKRSNYQNSLLWPILSDVANQCELCINGQMVKAKPEDWKDIFSAALLKEQRMAQGIDGGVVFLGLRTSQLSKARFSELLEIIFAYGAEHGVVWSEQSKQAGTDN